MKKYSLKEAWAFGRDRTFHPPSFDARLDAGYGTMKQTMKPRPMADGFPYDLEQDMGEVDPEDIDLLDNEEQMDKFQAMTHAYVPPVAKNNLNFRYDRNHYVDGKTRGVSDSILRDYVKLMVEFAITLKPRSAPPDFVVNQFGDKVLNGTVYGWSHAYPFRDEETEEPVFNWQELVDKHWEKEDIK